MSARPKSPPRPPAPVGTKGYRNGTNGPRAAPAARARLRRSEVAGRAAQGAAAQSTPRAAQGSPKARPPRPLRRGRVRAALGAPRGSRRHSRPLRATRRSGASPRCAPAHRHCPSRPPPIRSLRLLRAWCSSKHFPLSSTAMIASIACTQRCDGVAPGLAQRRFAQQRKRHIRCQARAERERRIGARGLPSTRRAKRGAPGARSHRRPCVQRPRQVPRRQVPRPRTSGRSRRTRWQAPRRPGSAPSAPPGCDGRTPCARPRYAVRAPPLRATRPRTPPRTPPRSAPDSRPPPVTTAAGTSAPNRRPAAGARSRGSIQSLAPARTEPPTRYPPHEPPTVWPGRSCPLSSTRPAREQCRVTLANWASPGAWRAC